MKHVRVPIKTFKKQPWGMLSQLGSTHEICGEDVKKINDNFSFVGGHRVRLFKFKKNVHWLIPKGTDLDISTVPPGGSAPRRRRQ